MSREAPGKVRGEGSGPEKLMAAEEPRHKNLTADNGLDPRARR